MNSECNRPDPLATGDPLLTFGTEKLAWQKFCLEALHPRKLACSLKRNQFNRKYIFQPWIFRGQPLVLKGGNTHLKFNSELTPEKCMVGWKDGPLTYWVSVTFEGQTRCSTSGVNIDCCRPTAYRWTRKPWNMEVLHPQNMVYNP